MITSLSDQLKRDEGVRLHPYKDTVGKLTIGIGRNLDDVGISDDEAELMLSNDIAVAEAQLEKTFPWTSGLDPIRRAVLVNMTFNMGIGGLAAFKQTLKLVEDGKYAEAGEEMLKSKWATQVGSRAQRLAIQMESGTWQ